MRWGRKWGWNYGWNWSSNCRRFPWLPRGWKTGMYGEVQWTPRGPVLISSDTASKEQEIRYLEQGIKDLEEEKKLIDQEIEEIKRRLEELKNKTNPDKE